MEPVFRIEREKQDFIFYKEYVNDKSILGVYLRNRLNVGSDHVVNYQDLINYGRDHIEVSQMDDGRYYFDFSV